MEHWPGHERLERPQTTDEQKDKSKSKQKEHRVESNIWRWPHLEHGSIGRTTLLLKDGRVKWSSVVDTSHDTRWLPLGRPVKVFPETRSPRVNTHEHSTRQRTEKGIQYLRAYFPDADFPCELLGGTLEEDAMERRRLNAFDPLLGNLLEIIPSHHTQSESIVVFPMGELGRELNISRFCSDGSGNMVFNPAGSPSFAFETPILQIASAVKPSEWIATPFSALLIRTHTSSSLLRLEGSRVTRVLDIARSETGGIPIVDSRILASGPDIVVVNRSGKVYKCNTYHGGKAMQLVGTHESNNDDRFWQLGITRRDDECFLASCNAIRHIDLRSAGSASNVFSLDHPSTIVTSFESPLHDYISRITTTADVIWLDDRFRGRPLLSYKHNRSFDRTLRVLTANLSGASLSLLTSQRNGFVTLYDVNRGSDRLLHCNSVPSCLPHNDNVPMFAVYDGHALVALPSDTELSFFRLCQRGSIHRQQIGFARLDEDRLGSVQEGHVTHQWGEDVQALDKEVDQLHTDFGPAGERHYTEVNLRGAYENMFAIADDIQESMDQDEFKDMLARLPDVWQDAEKIADTMLTTFDVISGIADGNGHTSHADFLAGTNINSKQVFDALTRGQIATEKLAGPAQWHYDIQNTSIPALRHHPINCNALNDYLKKLNLVSEIERHDSSMQRETEAREQLVVDLVLSNDVYSAREISKHHFAAGEAASNAGARPMEMSYSEEPSEVKFGYFRPIRKAGANHYTEGNQDGEQDSRVSSPLGVRLLLAEWELGTDPKDYTYRDPYGVADIDEQPIPQYRKPLVAIPMTQKKQMPPQRPPAVVTVATQPPVVRAVERAAPTTGSQIVQRTQSQPFDVGLDALSQEPMMMSTQVLPGPFGGRPAAGKKPHRSSLRRSGLNTEAGERSTLFSLVTPHSPWFDHAALNNALKRNKSVVCALTASYISTLAGYPLDSLKSRLQTTKTRVSVPKLAGLVYQEEGMKGFYRGLWIPLITISFVRAASFTIYSGTREYCRNHDYFSRNRISDAAIAGGISGALSGSLISFGSAPFELVKVRRQLEYSIASSKGIHMAKPPGTLEAVRDIFRTNGLSGLYVGFRLHFVRDTAGTALYFFEYDALRHLLGRQRSDEQGPTPPWLPIPVSLIPFVCGSFAGVTSWALIYPLDVVKTKIQQRALSGIPPRGVWETLHRLVRGPDPKDPKPVLAGIARIYQGLGVSAVRSITTHGLLWTFFDITSHYIDHLP
ncbi:hypothetical protein L210DRAFT_3472417 [Boletus edulis BED1]|uniref:Uncharacterized protein n=1 Tax=Boletus edulis BED1 TaxID=1328754 RepID=A0AAD4C3H5_BOLED|nr:hypothetical protein L210DRAFT_3472417 [Boletus edulis BED1]